MKKIFDFCYSTNQFLFWGTYCFIQTFASAFLLSLGYDNSTIGFIISSGIIASILIQSLLSDYADKTKKNTISIILVLVAIMIACFSGVALINSKNIFLSLIYVLNISIVNSVQPLLNGLSFKLEETGAKVNFGFGRAMGSLGYSTASLILGKLIAIKGPFTIPVTGLVFSIVMATIVTITNYFYGKAHKKTISQDKEETIVTTKEFIKNNKFFILLDIAGACMFFIQSSMVTYMLQIVTSLGGDSNDMGTIIAVMGLLEIPPLVLFNKIEKHVKLENIMLFSAVCYVFKAACYLFAKNLFLIYVAQVLQLVSFGLQMPAFILYINKNIDKKSANRGQALFTISTSIAGIIATFSGGLIIDNFGIKTLISITFCIVTFGALMLILLLKKKQY